MLLCCKIVGDELLIRLLSLGIFPKHNNGNFYIVDRYHFPVTVRSERHFCAAGIMRIGSVYQQQQQQQSKPSSHYVSFLQRILGVGKGKIKVFTTLAFKEMAYSIKNKMESRNTSTPVLQKKWNKLKRVRSASDQFDRLPDEILIAILSLLTLKEAAATSILSRRWRYLWMYTTGCWNFDFFEKTKLTVMEVRNAVYKLRYQAFKYINWIREVLKVHRGPYLDELRITTYLDATTAAQVDQLLCYASRKGVQKLELDFKNIFNFLFPYRYSFPSVENLAHSLQSGDNVLLRLQHHLRGVTLHHFRSFCCLRSLRLRYIDITEEVLQSIFSNCLLLQCLSVEESYRLENLQVHGLHLQHLEIINCFYLKSLEISAANLESFLYSGPYIDVPFRSVPQKLLKLTIGGSFGKSFVFESSKHVIYFSRLETLTLNVSCAVYRFPSVFPEMTNLKHLEVKVTGTGLHTLLAYIILIKASPFLSTFKMEYLEQPVMLRKALLGSYQYSGSMCEATRFVHQHLEEVELIGFLACAADLNIVSLLLENSVNLKRMVLQFTSRYFRYQRDSRMCIRSLRAKMPPGVELVIR